MKRTDGNSSSNGNVIRTPNELYPVVHDLSEFEYSDTGYCCTDRDLLGTLSSHLQPTTVPSRIWDLCPCEPSSICPCPTTRGGKQGRNKQQAPIDDDECMEPSVEYPLQVSPSLDVTISLEDDAARHKHHETTHRKVSSSPRRLGSCSQDTSLDDSGTSEHSHGRSRPKFHLRQKSRKLMNKLLTRANSNLIGAEFDTEIEPSQYGPEGEVGNHADTSDLPSRSSTRKFLDTYVLTQQIFKCRYSTLWECVHRGSGGRYCVKIFDRNTPALHSRAEEAAVLSELEMLRAICVERGGHASICQQVDVMAEGSKLYVILELAPGGNLLSRVVQEERLEEAWVKDVVRSLVQGLAFLHAQNVVHADLQPENVLLTSKKGGRSSCSINNGADLFNLATSSQSLQLQNGGSSSNAMAKIADFGSAVDLNVHEPFGSRYGSTTYTAPECLRADEPFDTSADMWSVGVLTYFMLSGASPWHEASKRKTTTKVLRAEYSFPPRLFSNVSRPAKQFIACLIHIDPAVRMTAEEALSHPWLRVEPPRHRTHRRGLSLGNDSQKSSSQSNGRGSPARSLTPTPKHKNHRRLTSLTKGIRSLFTMSPCSQPEDEFAPASDRTINTHPICSSETPLPEFPSINSPGSFESRLNPVPPRSNLPPLQGEPGDHNMHNRYHTWY